MMTETTICTDTPAQETPAQERAVVFEEALEAILFAAGHPVSYAALARVFGISPGKAKDKAFAFSLKYNDTGLPRGVILLCYDDSCQLCTKAEFLPEIRETLGIKKSGTLSTSSMEALAIVAYNQPVTRLFVDTLRRADSSYAMNNLIDRGLIECKGRLDVPGRPMLFGTTADFLRSFGLPSIAALPKGSEELLGMFEKAKEIERREEEIEGAVQTSLDELPLADPTADTTAPADASESADSSAAPIAEDPSAEDDQFAD